MEIDYLQLISTVGFPIVAYLLIYLDLRRVLQTHTETLEKLIARLEARL